MLHISKIVWLGEGFSGGFFVSAFIGNKLTGVVLNTMHWCTHINEKHWCTHIN